MHLANLVRKNFIRRVDIGIVFVIKEPIHVQTPIVKKKD